jgi:ceramide glucosyltransferase
MAALIGIPLGCVLAGALVYCVLAIVAARRFLAVKPPPLETIIPISVLKPLSGADEGLEENLRSFFEQDYPEFEVLFAVRTPGDAAMPVVQKLQAAYPGVPARLIVTGEPPYPNAKVFSLDRMKSAAAHEVLVMSDSDIRVTQEMLSVVAAEFQNPKLGLATCPYRAVPGRSLWSRLEAVGMNTEFLSGVLVARMLDGMKFAIGPTIVARRRALDVIGGFDAVKDYLAEDFVMGKLVAEAGFDVILSSYVIEHRIGTQGFRQNAAHRLRWCRSTRRSRPAGYVGQVFTNPLPVAMLLALCWPSPLMLGIAIAFRIAAAWAVAGWVLHDPLTRSRWWLVPVQDVLSFAFWLAGFFGNTIAWRGRQYYLYRDGRFELVPSK